MAVGVGLHYSTHGHLRSNVLLHSAEVLAQGGERDFRPRRARRHTAQDFYSRCHFRDYIGSSPRSEVTQGLLPHARPFYPVPSVLSRSVLVPRQNEVHSDLGLHLNRLVVQDIGTIPPLLDGIDRGRNEHGMSRQNLQIIDGSRLADDRSQNDWALN